jgi:hypothetical protein
MDDLRRSNPDDPPDPDPDPDPEPEPDPRRSALVRLLIVLLLVLGGVALVHKLASVSHLQDCVMSGRTNCAPIDLPLHRGR